MPTPLTVPEDTWRYDIDRKRSLQDLIDSAQKSGCLINPLIIEHQNSFMTRMRFGDHAKFALFNPHRKIFSEQMLSVLGGHTVFQVPILWDGLAFAELHPDLQRSFVIPILGAVLVLDDKEFVVYLGGNEKFRLIELMEEKEGIPWNDGARFLGS